MLKIFEYEAYGRGNYNLYDALSVLEFLLSPFGSCLRLIFNIVTYVTGEEQQSLGDFLVFRFIPETDTKAESIMRHKVG
jgi:hypothetical protein